MSMRGKATMATKEAAGGWSRETEQKLLNAALARAPALGWTRMLVTAARDIGLSAPEVELLIPDGARELAALYATRCDDAALEALAGVDPAMLKVRERIRRGVLARCDAAMGEPEATRRWAGFLALPANTPLGLRLAWASADRLWRWAGDAATDENHYSKRALLAPILVSTLAVRLAAGEAAAAAHLDRRIAAIMTFERWKAGLKPAPLARRGGALGGMRYGGR
jgi:ubiquinone biosynthesis protein COQ9